MRAATPNSLVTAILDYLRLRNIPAWRQNTGAMRVGNRYVRFGEAGQPDVMGILPASDHVERVYGPDAALYTAGRLLCIEAKTGKGRLSADQRAWLARAEAAGALCLVARSLDELREALAAAGYPEQGERS